MTAQERVDKMFADAKQQGLEWPTDGMIVDAIHDAEFDTLHHPLKISQEHDQDQARMREIWKNAISQSWALLLTAD